MSDTGIIVFIYCRLFIPFLQFVILMHNYSTANRCDSILDADGCENINCLDELKTLEKTITDNEKKIKESYRLALIDNIRFDLALEKMAQKRIDNRYTDYIETFPIETIKEFRALKDSKDDDYKFVLSAIRGLYKGSLKSLRLKSVNGQLMYNRDVIVPANMQIIEAIYGERLKYINEHELIDDARSMKNQIKRHIKGFSFRFEK